MRAVLKLFRPDFVIIDVPPVLLVADAAVLAMADTCLLVVTRFWLSSSLSGQSYRWRLGARVVPSWRRPRCPRSGAHVAPGPQAREAGARGPGGRSVASRGDDPALSPRAVQPERVGE
jgi:hypothetical protein